MGKPTAPNVPKPQRFLINVLWNWVAVAANIFTGIILTRYLIRKLGDERYGVWALAFTLIEYVFLFDLGFRSAVVALVSRRRAEGDIAGINAVLSTALAYFALVAGAICALTYAFAGEVFRLFQISEPLRADFTFLLTLVGFTWALGIMASVFQASIEASQNFRNYSHIMVVILLLRSTGLALLLYCGYGLREMGVLVVCCQILGYGLMFSTFLRTFPEVRCSRASISWGTWKELASFGIHSLVASSGLLFLNQGPPLMVGHFRSEAFVGYYSVPARLLQYIVDIVTRIGFVTVPKTSELLARGETGQIVKLGIFINRYCLALFLPITIFLVFYGEPLVLRWLGPTYARQSGPLIPIMVCAITLGVAGQFNSSQLLFGMGRHRLYARSLVVEGIALLAGMMFALPRYGIIGGAWVAATLLVVNRGLITPMMVCRYLNVNYFSYMASIYGRPLLTALPVAAVVFWWRSSAIIKGETWTELIVAASGTASLYLTLCLFTCLDAEHRDLFWRTLRARLPSRRPVPV